MGSGDQWTYARVAAFLAFSACIKSSISIFADDTKIWSVTTSEADSYLLQEDLNSLVLWSKKWLLQLHPEKCKVMPLGHSQQTTYTTEEYGITNVQYSTTHN